MALIKDTIEGELSFTPEGIEVQRSFIVTGVTGIDSAKLYNAAISQGIPRIGDSHPIINGITVANITVTVNEAGVYNVDVSYDVNKNTPPDEGNDQEGLFLEPTINVDATVTPLATQKDKDDIQLVINITKADGTTDTQVGDVEIQVPITVLSFTREETFSPVIKNLEFAGAVNESKIGLFPERTLLCTSISGTTNNEGLSYSVAYTFQHNPQTWDITAVYKDDETDKPHNDIDLDTGNGVGIFRVYQEKKYAKLNIDFEFSKVPSNGFIVGF
jgi:hypothetical protein